MVIAAVQPRRIQADLLPKQAQFFRSQKREVLYSGAFGAGKSRAAAFALVKHAILPGNLVLLTRKTLTTLKQTTLRTLLAWDGDLPPVLPEDTYEHKKQECLIKIRGGGEIFYTGFENSDRIRSLNLGAVVCDEATEMAKEEYIMLLGRLRNNADSCKQILCACNPSSPSHFLHTRFFDETAPDREVITTTSFDNTFLPADYLQSLNGFTGQNKARYVLGQWVNFEGLVYDMFNRGLVRLLYQKWDKVFLGIDEGYENPCAIAVWGVQGKQLHCISEVYRRNMLPETVVQTAKELCEQYGARRVIVDKSAAGLIASLRAAGMEVSPSDGGITVFDGIKKCQNKIAAGELTIDPACENAIRELESYRWKEGRDEPVKEFDHFADSMRYVVTYLFKGGIDRDKYGALDPRDIYKGAPVQELIARLNEANDDFEVNAVFRAMKDGNCPELREALKREDSIPASEILELLEAGI